MDQVTKHHGNIMNYFIAISILVLLSGCNENTYSINIDENLNTKLVQIEVLPSENQQTHKVYSLGELDPHTTYYGENDWKILYDSVKIFEYREFVLNRNDVAKYEFNLTKKGSSVVVEMYINGTIISK